MAIGLLFGFAIGFCALAWAFAASAPAFQFARKQVVSIICFAVFSAVGGGLLWHVVENFVPGMRAHVSAKPVDFEVNAVGKPMANGVVRSASSVNEGNGEKPNGNALAHVVDKPAGDKLTISAEMALAIASLVVAVVTGVYLVSMQNALQAGRDMVKELGAYKGKLDNDIKELDAYKIMLVNESKDFKALRQQYNGLVGGLAEPLNRLGGLLNQIGTLLQRRTKKGSQVEQDFYNINKCIADLVMELDWVTRGTNLLSALYGGDFAKANLEASQFCLFLSSIGVHSELVKVTIRPIRDTLLQLQRNRADLFSRQSNYSDLAPLLDQLIQIEPAPR